MHILDRLASRPAVCGHRGDSIACPENTLAAIRSAAGAGAMFCEIDVQRTSDGVFVLMHDQTVDRTTSGRGLVSRLSHAEIAGLDAGSWRSEAFAGEPVPTLAAVFALAAELEIGLVVEIKDRLADRAWLEGFAALAAAGDAGERILVSSFDHALLREMKEVAPDLKTWGITHSRHVDIGSIAKAARLDMVSIEFGMYRASDARALKQSSVAVGYSLPRPDVFAADERYGGPYRGALRDALRSGLVDIVVADDVGWVVARLEEAGRSPAP